jgi:Spy/CpxP family protein refolding chaperone
MRTPFLIAITLGLVGCSHDQPPPQYGSSQTTGGAVDNSGAAQQPVPPVSEPTTTSSQKEQPPADANEPSRNAWHVDLMHSALDLSSLTPTQRSRVQALIEQKTSQNANIRAANAQLLTALADAIQSGNVSTTALTPRVQAVVTAALTDEPADRSMLEALHDTLTPGQRAELVEKAESRMDAASERNGGRLGWVATMLNLTPAQTAQIEENLRTSESASNQDMRTEVRQEHTRLLEAFRGDKFVMSQVVPPKTGDALGHFVGHIVFMAQAAAPVLTNEQRATVASTLRRWAAK